MKISKSIKDRIINNEYDWVELMDCIMASLQEQDEHIIDYMENRDYFQCYGYTGDLKDEISYLKKQLSNVEDLGLPEIKTLGDYFKLEFLMENFDKLDIDKIKKTL